MKRPKIELDLKNPRTHGRKQIRQIARSIEAFGFSVPVLRRRHLTVLFCDLVGSTAIATQLDPEEWREIVASYHRAATEATTQFGGHVAQYLGDGVMAYFGWPEAHDNDAERAAAILESIYLGSTKNRYMRNWR